MTAERCVITCLYCNREGCRQGYSCLKRRNELLIKKMDAMEADLQGALTWLSLIDFQSDWVEAVAAAHHWEKGVHY